MSTELTKNENSVVFSLTLLHQHVQCIWYNYFQLQIHNYDIKDVKTELKHLIYMEKESRKGLVFLDEKQHEMTLEINEVLSIHPTVIRSYTPTL